MISLDYLIWLNEAICQDSGEQSIIINKNNLLSALSVQQWYFDDSLLAAALIRSITIGHGFQDGNKRTAAAAGATICKFTCTDMFYDESFDTINENAIKTDWLIGAIEDDLMTEEEFNHIYELIEKASLEDAIAQS